MKNLNRKTSVKCTNSVLVVAAVLLVSLCVATVWILLSSIDQQESEQLRRNLAKRLIAALFQQHEDTEGEVISQNYSTTRSSVTRTILQYKRPGVEYKRAGMEINLNGTWSLTRSEDFDEYLREAGVGLLKRKMASSLGQTLTISHQELHFEIVVTFIGIYSKTLAFDIGDEFEIDVGPGVNTTVKSGIDDGKLVLEGKCGGKPYKNTRTIENGELVQVMQLGDATCRRIFTRKS